MTRLDALFGQIAREQDELRAADSMKERLVERVGGDSGSSGRFRRSWVFALAAAVGVVAVVATMLGFDSSLGVKVGGSDEAPLLGAWLDASALAPLPFEFSDGSRFELAPKSKVRLLELERARARVELGSGSMSVHVVPRRATNWRLDAGPFSVRVTGTRFRLSYSREADVFELYLEEGQVELSGCVFGQGRKLAAGQSVKASCAKPSLEVSYGDRRAARAEMEGAPAAARPAENRAPSEQAALGSADRGVSPEGRPGASASAGKPVLSSWPALAKAGDYEGAFSAVRAQGFEVECGRVNADSLALLSDVARHAGAPRQAETALLALRRRFPGTSDAALAAFALGRLEFDEYQAYRRAATWFDTYLGERPSGPMAREALGRLLEARTRARDLALARGVAAQYLQKYPSGPHAELASRVVSSP